MASRSETQAAGGRSPDRRSADRRTVPDPGYSGPERRATSRRSGRDRREG